METVTILGFIAAICTTSSFVPQVVKILKTKSTKDISLMMYSVLATGVLLWMIYGILIKEIPIIAANAVGFVLVGTILACKIIYK
jgi:MtN3 and saliva related transmembrane protein